MSMPLAHYLKDFSSPKPSSLVSDTVGFDMDAFGMDDEPALELPQPDPIDVEAVRAQAYAEGFEAASQQLAEQHAQEIHRLEAHHAEQIKEQEKAHQKALATVIAQGLEKIAASVSDVVGEQTVAAVAPFLQEALVETALNDIAALLKEAILEGQAGVVTVRGPEALFERLKMQMDGHEDLLRHIEVDDLDLAVDIHDAALVTRISAWTASLKKVLA
ncbi:hypothetical protein H4S14_002014 [Agrobacterium vitis]|nr:hypothetical protein [Agrobacterium vitis]MBE1438269.1 hypothetical protein [Agrobacterium vitis]